MKFKLIIFILTIIFFNLNTSIAQTNQHLSKDFSLSAADVEFFSFAGDFKGTYQVLPSEIRLNLTNGTIFLRDNVSYKGRRKLSELLVGLATKNGRSWKIIGTSKTLELNKIMSPDDKVNIANISFSIPIDNSIKLSDCWLVFEIGDYILDSGENKAKVRGTAYSHFKKDMFSDYKGELADRPEDCIPYDVKTLRIVDIGNQGWRLVSNEAHFLAILDNESDAKAALTMAKKYTQVCYIGRGNRRANRRNYILQYWK